jgi:hypothetical protein
MDENKKINERMLGKKRCFFRKITSLREDALKQDNYSAVPQIFTGYRRSFAIPPERLRNNLPRSGGILMGNLCNTHGQFDTNTLCSK